MKNLEHKGYIGSIDFSLEDNVIHGKIIGINDLVTYEGNTIEEIKNSFQESVEDYLATCLELGREPDRFYKGIFNVRTSNEVHKKLNLIAEQKNLKLNQVINKALHYLIDNQNKVFS